MRIISGQYKGRRLSPPRNLPVRPTTDMSKEALFNVLNNHVHFQDLRVLDLFTGTGNISFEFASRGCKPIICVDTDKGCIKYIKQVTAEFEFEITPLQNDVFKFLESHQSKYDLIFADPPYGMELMQFEKMVALIFDKHLLEPSGLLIVEHSKHTKLNQLPQFSFQRNYGGSVFSFFEIKDTNSDEGTADSE